RPASGLPRAPVDDAGNQLGRCLRADHDRVPPEQQLGCRRQQLGLVGRLAVEFAVVVAATAAGGVVAHVHLEVAGGEGDAGRAVDLQGVPPLPVQSDL